MAKPKRQTKTTKPTSKAKPKAKARPMPKTKARPKVQAKAKAKPKAAAKPTPKPKATAVAKPKAKAKAAPSGIDRVDLHAALVRLRPAFAADPLLQRGGVDSVLGAVDDRIDQATDLASLFAKLAPAAAYAMARVALAAPSIAKTSPAVWNDGDAAEPFALTVVAGDLSCDGELSLYDGRYVVVLGNVHAPLLAAEDNSTLVIAGNATTGAVSGEANVLVGGELTKTSG